MVKCVHRLRCSLDLSCANHVYCSSLPCYCNSPKKKYFHKFMLLTILNILNTFEL